MKSDMGCHLAYLDLTLAHTKGQGRGHVYFDGRYLKIVTDIANITITTGYEVKYGLSISIF